MSLKDLAGHLEMSVPGVGFAVERGEAIAQVNHRKGDVKDRTDGVGSRK